MDIEAVILTGGASRRMGRDKALLIVEGQPLAVRIAEAVSVLGIPVTILGREELPGFGFLRDEAEFEGPVAALSRFRPSSEAVLALSCDLPDFDANVVGLLIERLEGRDAAILEFEKRSQPLCGIYRRAAFEKLRSLYDLGERRLIRWLEELDVALVTEDDLARAGLSRDIGKNVNTPVDLER